jgi:hypothetical protein
LRIAEAVRGLSADEAMIDGEAVVFMDDGRTDFHALLTKRGWLMASFVAFDLLRLNGDDLRLRPYEARRAGSIGGSTAGGSGADGLASGHASAAPRADRLFGKPGGRRGLG